jgi:hypothetical protein
VLCATTYFFWYIPVCRLLHSTYGSYKTVNYAQLGRELGLVKNWRKSSTVFVNPSSHRSGIEVVVWHSAVSTAYFRSPSCHRSCGLSLSRTVKQWSQAVIFRWAILAQLRLRLGLKNWRQRKTPRTQYCTVRHFNSKKHVTTNQSTIRQTYLWLPENITVQCCICNSS